jgi:hypothetical protein
MSTEYANERELDKLRVYTVENVKKWELDSENPEAR